MDLGVTGALEDKKEKRDNEISAFSEVLRTLQEKISSDVQSLITIETSEKATVGINDLCFNISEPQTGSGPSTVGRGLFQKMEE